ncbi:predicted protein [Aspergillus nidulans FGSC A4]|uniref:Uncharacterized protein n=1 Tax=Emericella nidulans (strain FGSC A4 / ATCC 38163 / CBS 112.46 / NRRL 194 / M139) TaxID=227321 RepID=Q5B5H5_EMENI|nr:hypothetical protein [Aspergillus nidulans FGSC A4]EAA59304.1 predicted protein [Aspergillus nidulans FGSC A4]CBF74484.1 TPA: hypothetical protein ANIA_04205 [Aspergillus nidulans FGSC A4]|eukprot:XP_661809.1 predicted protein [Aspergillus nidulans FGSC A4]
MLRNSLSIVPFYGHRVAWVFSFLSDPLKSNNSDHNQAAALGDILPHPMLQADPTTRALSQLCLSPASTLVAGPGC